MARNSSGVYSLPQASFVALTTIESAKVNSNFSDIATALTQSLATTGVSTMTGQLKAVAGNAGAPGYTFSGNLGTGFFLPDTNSIGIAVASATNAIINATGTWNIYTTVNIGGALRVSSSLAAGGKISTSSSLAVEGSADLADIEIGGLFLASATAQFSGTIVASGTASLQGNLYVAGSVLGGLTVTATIVVGGDVTVTGKNPGRLLAIIEDVKSTGTLAQVLASGTDNVRELNTLSFNLNSSVTLASNRFTLQPGSYEISWFAPTNTVNSGGLHQTFLYNQSSTTELKRGTGGNVDIGDTDDGDTTFSEGSHALTIASTTSFEIRHYTQTGVLRGGQTVSVGNEIYTRVIVRAA